MKANDLNQAFFLDWGLPFIKREFPGLEDHVAVGRYSGSQTIGQTITCHKTTAGNLASTSS